MDTISVKNLYKNFGKTEVLKDISFHLKEGEVLAILGESGCGKSTLLGCIAGFLPINSGEIFIQNDSVACKGFCVAPHKREVGILFQDFAIFPHLNVYENIAFGLSKLNKEQKEMRIKELLEMLGLEGLEKRYLHEISGGQAQRVALARAIAPNPKILLLDEPFSSLNSDLSNKMRKDLKEIIKKNNLNVILVTHNKEDAFYLANRILIVKNGKIIDSGTPRDLYEYPSNLDSAKFLGAVNFIEDLTSIKDEAFRVWLAKRKGIFRPKHLKIAESGILVKLLENKFFGDWIEGVVEYEKHQFSIHYKCEKNVGDEFYLAFD